MKKIMFSDRYGLTQAALEGRKTMTRRIANPLSSNIDRRIFGTLSEGSCIIERKLVYTEGQRIFVSQYKFGEVVAIAQSYETLANSGTEQLGNMLATSSTFKEEYTGAGWGNKMFVKAELMPHRIRITDIKVERLQDISDEECLKEGISTTNVFEVGYGIPEAYVFDGSEIAYITPRQAFAALIDKVSGKGTWESNPYVFCYTFELVD